MIPDDALERLRRGYEAFNRGDIEAVLDDLEPDVALDERPDAPDPRHAVTREEARRGFESLHEEFEDYRFEPLEFIPEGDHVIVLVRQSGRGRRSGVPVSGEIVHAWQVSPAGRVSRLRAFSSVNEARAAIGPDRV